MQSRTDLVTVVVRVGNSDIFAIKFVEEIVNVLAKIEEIDNSI